MPLVAPPPSPLHIVENIKRVLSCLLVGVRLEVKQKGVVVRVLILAPIGTRWTDPNVASRVRRIIVRRVETEPAKTPV